jgi:methylphosphotriester-DNA--protein-cysteine methyltransferase
MYGTHRIPLCQKPLNSNQGAADNCNGPPRHDREFPYSKVDMNFIQILGRWRSDAMIRYLHMQAQPIVQHFAAKMYNNGNYSFLPDETVPLLDEDAEL